MCLQMVGLCCLMLYTVYLLYILCQILRLSPSQSYQSLLQPQLQKIKQYNNGVMNQQTEINDKQQKQTEGKYKYLVDMTRNQFSPNLRKYYNDSFSKGSNSQQRRSPHLKSNQRRSPSHNELYQRRSIHPYSPSCNTFNPRRETTQEEFSPYDEGIEKQQERINKELLEENAFLKIQLAQGGQLIEQLKIELAKRQSDIVKIQQMSQADLRYFEKVVTEMTNEIQLVLTKNKILENELIVVKGRLQEELKRADQYIKYEQQKRRLQDFRKRDDLRFIHQARGQMDARRNTPQPISKRSVGKLMSRPVGNKQHQQTLKTSKIKIQQDESLNQSHFESTKAQQNRSAILQGGKENRQGQSLINSIKSMQIKITGEQASSLKDVWKWLKGMGQAHSYLKKWKSKATEAIPYCASEKLKELIREACGYIE